VLRQWNWVVLGALGMALPINILLVGCDSALVLLFPTIRQFSPGDLLVGVRLALVNLAKFLFLGVTGGLALLVYLLLRWLAEVPEGALGAAWVGLPVESLGSVWITSLLSVSFDPSRHLDADDCRPLRPGPCRLVSAV